jgi:CubicO group peptidase (beta-lactamase class C family)
MRISLIISIILFFAQVCIAQDYRKSIEKARFLIKQHQQQTNIPGIQVALMADGKLIWSDSFGYSDLEKGEKVNSETKFRIASVSKPVTSIALGKLIEENLMDPDRDIRYYVPEFPEKESSITARQLAGSVSGIRHYNSSDPEYNQNNYPDILSSLEVFQNDPLEFEPGKEYLYSSYGWVLLSAAMERSSGMSFFELMEETWRDRHMENTAFDYPDSIIPAESKFYIQGRSDKRIVAPNDNRSYMYAGGGYLSTAEDLVKMGTQFISDQYLSGDTREILTSALTLKDGSSTYYGLGWETGQSRLDTRVIFHSGNMSTARSHLVIYPDEGIVFAYLSNTGDHVFFNDREAQSIAELFLTEKRKLDNFSEENSNMEGEWQISTTSLRNRKTKGFLRMGRDNNGMLSGEITFKRSRKKETFPVILVNTSYEQMHLIAVSPMFIDFYISSDKDSFTGKWQHDFNVKGIPEEDEYWSPRKVEGFRDD